MTRTSVICDPRTGNIVGYVCLSATHIERGWLSKAEQHNRPDAIPEALLGELAVDRRYQGCGFASSLMFFALTTAVRFSNAVDYFCVLTHPIDGGVRALLPIIWL